MQPGDQSTTAEPADDTPTLQTTLFPLPESRPLPIRELLTTDQPRNRLLQHGAAALSDAELLAIITGVQCLETAQRLLIAAGGLRGLSAHQHGRAATARRRHQRRPSRAAQGRDRAGDARRTRRAAGAPADQEP